MNKAVQRYVEAASGLSDLTKKRAERIVKQLVKQGETAADQAGDLVEELMARQRHNREAITELVKTETQRAVRAMGLATTGEVERLQRQVAELKRELDRTAGGGAPATDTESATKKAGKKTAKKAAKKASKKTAKKAGKKAAKKASKGTAKKATTGSPAKRAKKTAARKKTQRGGS